MTATFYVLDDVPLDDSEASFHQKAVIAALAAFIARESSMPARDAFEAGDSIIREQRKRQASTPVPVYRLTTSQRHIGEFIAAEAVRKAAQVEVVQWMQTLDRAATHTEIRVGAGAGDASIAALQRRGILVRIGSDEDAAEEKP